jgi:hypothetical protein
MSRAAVAGLLKWKDIAVWLLDRNAVVQTSIENAPEDGRFNLSACQAPSGSQVQTYIERVRTSESEQPLASRSTKKHTYDIRIDVDFVGFGNRGFGVTPYYIDQPLRPTDGDAIPKRSTGQTRKQQGSRN